MTVAAAIKDTPVISFKPALFIAETVAAEFSRIMALISPRTSFAAESSATSTMNHTSTPPPCCVEAINLLLDETVPDVVRFTTLDTLTSWNETPSSELETATRNALR